MSFFEELFGRKKVTSKELRIQLRRIERQRLRKRRELKKVESRQAELIEQVKEARRDGNSIEVDYMWEELKGLKIDKAYLIREATVLNLEGITVKKYVRGMERMERRDNHEGIQKLLTRLRGSGLDAKLQAENINTDEYLDELRAVLEETGLEMDLMTDGDEDPEKAAFLAEIDEINAAEESGDLGLASERETELARKLEDPEAP